MSSPEEYDNICHKQSRLPEPEDKGFNVTVMGMSKGLASQKFKIQCCNHFEKKQTPKLHDG